MSEVNQENQTETTTTTTAAPSPEPEITLDDVYKEAGSPPLEGAAPAPVPAAAPAPVQQPVVQPQIAQPPDPFDSEAHRAYLANLARTAQSTQAGLMQVATMLSQQQAKEQKAALEADITKAVSTVNEVVKHPKPNVVRALLDAKVDENPQFKALWNNRTKNPVAWSNALKVVAKEFASEFELKVDPKLDASQRALKRAQEGMMATTAAESNQSPLEERLATATGSDFDSLWEQARSG